MAVAIDPDKIPGKDLDPDEIEAQAATISGIATSVEENGFQVQSQWQAMAGVYSAPESATLLGLMHPVNASATAVAGNLSTLAGALRQFAADVRPIKQELDALRLAAQDFVDTTVRGGVDRREVNPAWSSVQAVAGYTHAAAYSSASIGGSAGTAALPAQYLTVHKQWHEDQLSVDHNNRLLAQVNAQQVRLWEAERACANKIRALFGGAALHAATGAGEDPLAYGLDQIPAGTAMPWGADVARTEGCGEAAVSFVFKDFLWQGILVNGIWGTITGLGTLVLGYNPQTSAFFSGDAYGAAWGNLGKLAVVLNTGLFAPLLLADTLARGNGGGGLLPQGVRDFYKDAAETTVMTGKALLAWDEWGHEPGTALGEVVFNVGTILIPGGAAVAGVKSAGTAASVLSKMARVVDLVDPGAWAAGGVAKAGGIAIKGFDHLLGGIGDVSKIGDGLDAPMQVLHGSDAVSALHHMVDQLGIPMRDISAGSLADGTPILRGPGVEMRLEAGAFDGVKAADGGAGVVAPARETELVTAGGGSDAARVTNSIVDDAPVRTETAGGSSVEHTIAHDPETTTGGGAGHGDGGGYNGSVGDAVVPPPRNSDELLRMKLEQAGFTAENGFSVDDVHHLRLSDTASLTDAQRELLRVLRELVPPLNAGSSVTKVIPFSDVEKYLSGAYSPRVGGFMLHSADVDTSVPLQQIVTDLRLDYVPGKGDINEFTAGGSDSYGFLVFRPSLPQSISVPFDSSFISGGVSHAPPFTGNGFISNADDVFRPEFFAVERMPLTDGAELWLNEKGAPRLVAVLDEVRGFVEVAP